MRFTLQLPGQAGWSGRGIVHSYRGGRGNRRREGGRGEDNYGIREVSSLQTHLIQSGGT